MTVKAELPNLQRIGCDAGWLQLAKPLLTDARSQLGRIGAQHRNHFEITTEQGVITARGAGRLHQRKFARTELPCVGDWVIVRAQPNSELQSIEHILPRRSLITRRAAGDSDRVQVVAANVDIVLVVLAANDPRAVERLPRLLAIVESSGAQAQLLWNKIDLLPAGPPAASLPPAVASTPALYLSAHTGAGLDTLRAVGQPGQTLAMLGASGAGKSSLINTWLGRTEQRTEVTGSDEKGRHTTTTRQLIVTEQGQVLLDTPGMRELGLWDADSTLTESFPDIEVLAQQCRFRDCQHGSEPGCAVRAAIAAGTLPAGRLHRWQVLQGEIQALQTPERAAAQRRSRERRPTTPLARRWRA